MRCKLKPMPENIGAVKFFFSSLLLLLARLLASIKSMHHTYISDEPKMQFALQRAGDGVVHRVPKFIFDAFSLYSFKRSLCCSGWCYCRSFFSESLSDGLFRELLFFYSSILHSFWALLLFVYYVHFCHHHHPSVPFHICTHIFYSHLKYLHLCLFSPQFSATRCCCSAFECFFTRFFFLFRTKKALLHFFQLFGAFFPCTLSFVLYEYVWANKHANIATTNEHEIKNLPKKLHV